MTPEQQGSGVPEHIARLQGTVQATTVAPQLVAGP